MRPSGIIVASRDKFYPASDRPLDDAYADYFEWEKPGANRCDERMEAFFEQHSTAPLRVESVRADAVGSVWMRLGSDHTLEVFPDDSLGEEMWRFFQPSTKDDHFVVLGNGIE